MLQSELMTVKLREAEGLQHQKESLNRVEDIQAMWNAFRESQAQESGISGSGKQESGNSGAGFLRSGAGLLQSKILGRPKSAAHIDSKHLSEKVLEARFLAQVNELQHKVCHLLFRVLITYACCRVMGCQLILPPFNVFSTYFGKLPLIWIALTYDFELI